MSRRVPVLSWVTALVIVATTACGHTPTACGGTRPCDGSRMCRFDGSCGSVPRTSSAPSGALRITAADWGVTHEGSLPFPRADDRLALGGSAEATVHLRFAPLPAPTEVQRAVLALAPPADGSGRHAPAQMVAYPTYPFEGDALGEQGAPGRRGSFRVARGVAPASGRMLRLDVTEPMRAAARRTDGALHVAIRAVGAQNGPPWHLASPRATNASRRPALELVLE